MALDFPNAPNTGDIFQNWQWDGIKWSALGGGGAGFSTGDVKLTSKIAADSGWVMMNDGTIGSAASGASTFADPTTQALFTLFFTNYSDATAPLLTSTGGATTRAAQASAAAAWAANCRMTLPAQLGRALCCAGAGAGLTSRALGASVGAETNTQDNNSLASHLHYPGGNYGFMVYNSSGIASNYGTNAYGGVNATANTGSSTPTTIMQPSMFWNVMIKL